jgi:hypothetical protein
MLTNDRVADTLVEFPVFLIDEDHDTCQRMLAMAYMSGIVASDLVFPEETNPIRAVEPGPECDGGLSLAIGHLLRQ